ncbi:phosphatase PAP2 family protein [Boseongicola aestuarii]|uniref:Inositolphosphotransferase Aur1/Ipt1 domain-containing protein n=1 Tax=Boseongicola aestuarii TaxID=1470561 RepID=A0A238IWJ0_9RHOB|nr:phosphatase PAP2 family protein [Boseongicola aestuarii]SMX22054.1 hypothetical protein BOA8489_00141 [Boseongicola aestuarii]
MRIYETGKFLNRSEVAFGAIAGLLSLLWPAVAISKSVNIEHGLTALAFALQVGLILLGIYMRIRHQSELFARFLIALGLYLIFVTSVANLIEMRFPVDALRLDPILQASDDFLSYNWSNSIVWLAAWPDVGNTLAIVYSTSLYQLVIVMAVLAFSGAGIPLYRYLATAAVSLFITVTIWMIWPSFGPAISQTIPNESNIEMTIVVDSSYQKEMLRRISEGPSSVPPTTTLGLIAFPSYHTVMMLLVIVYAWRTVAGWPLFLFNIPMLPAILLQGAHYIADVVAGLIVFLFSAWLAKKIVVKPARVKSPERL